MSISPTTSSTGFFLYPNIENKEGPETPSQPITLKDRVCLMADRIGYRFYAGVLNLPHIMPTEFADAKYERTKRIFFADQPKPFAEIKRRILSYSKIDAMSLEEKMQKENIELYGESESWAGRIEKENIELYSDPKERKNKVKKYADNLYKGKKSTISKEEQWLVLSLCKQELHNLYRKEPKYLDSRHTSLWIINRNNRAVLAKHKQEWDKLSPSEKAEKIFGKRDKYEIAAATTTAISCFFLCHTIYQFWSSHR